MTLNPLQAAKMALALAALGALLACGPRGTQTVNTAASGPPSGEADYLAPPELVGAARRPGGAIELSGRARPDATIRLASPEGAAFFARADAKGDWRIDTPPSGAPRLFSLSMSDGGAEVLAIGYLFVAPDGLVARLRAGGGSEALAPRERGRVTLTLDYDNARAATLTGHASPGAAFSLRVDGVERSQGSADATTRFVLPLSQPLAAGDHDFDLAGDNAELRLSAPISAPAPLAGAPFAVQRLGVGWRVDWVTPGGGEQTTLILPVQPA
jgi:hypothetical protein